jgi:nitroreductase
LSKSLNEDALNKLFSGARTFNRFLPDPVTDDVIHRLYSLLKWGPTAFNSQPARYAFVKSQEAKSHLAPALSSGNRDKTLAAPLTVLIAYDSQFYEHLPNQFPTYDAKALFGKSPALIEPTALRNSSLQGAYLIIAARALGLDVGPMSGFNPGLINDTFFPDGRYKINFIANLGYGDPASVYPRGPRLDFTEAASIL